MYPNVDFIEFSNNDAIIEGRASEDVEELDDLQEAKKILEMDVDGYEEFYPFRINIREVGGGFTFFELPTPILEIV